MNEARRQPRPRGARAAAWAVALAVFTASPASAQPEPERPYAALRAVADRETPSPADAPTTVAEPGADLAVIPPGTPEGDAARMPLDAALAELRASAPPPADPPPPVDPEDAARARALFDEADARFAAGERAAGLSALQRATELDPGSSEAWLRLGDAHLDDRAAASALRAFARAADLGSDAPSAMIALGRAALLQGRDDDAARAFDRAIRGADDQGALAPAVGAVAGIGLADALRASGKLAAANEAARRALDATTDASTLPAEAFERSVRLASEYADVARRRGEILEAIGDAAMRLNRPDEALAAYDAALDEPLLDPASVDLRRLDAAERLGRPAKALLILIEAAERAGGRLNDRQIDRLRDLSRRAGAADETAQALAELRDELGEPLPRTIESALVRARAAVLPPEPGAAVLLEWLTKAPGDGAAARDLFDSADWMNAFAFAGALAEASPIHAPVYGRALHAVVQQPALITDASSGAASGASDFLRLVAAELALLHRSLDDADRLVRSLDMASLPAWSSLDARVAAARGEWERVTRRIDAMDPERSEDWRLARAEALRAAQRFPEALETIAPLLNEAAPGPELINALLDGAELALGAGDPDRAEAWLEQAIVADPADPRPYQGLIALSLPDGPRPDPARLRDVVRQLRRADPSSPLLQFLAAQELAQRGQLVRAESALRRLVEAGRGDPRVFDVLVEVWSRLAAIDRGESFARAEAWLMERRTEDPDDANLSAALARILAFQGRPEEANAFLAERLERRFDRDLALLRETLLRDALQRPEEAADLMRRRLESGPRGLDDGLDYANLLASEGRFLDAARELARALPPGAELTEPQARAAQALLTRTVTIALERGGDRSEARAAADDMLTRFIEQDRRLRPDFYRARIAVRALQPKVGVDAVVEAARAASELDPENATLRLIEAGEQLRLADRPGDAIEAARRIASERPEDEALLFALYRLMVLAGDDDALRALILDDLPADRLRRLAAQIGFDADRMRDDRSTRVELLYASAINLHAANQRPGARRLYRAVLELDPDHGMAANNLGYDLLEIGRLDEAEPLLELAAREEPDSANVLDSLGWLRYRQGRLSDERDAEGNVSPGARTLLLRALEAPLGETNGVIIDHLGDTHYRMNEPDQARLRWTEADRRVRDELNIARQRGDLVSIEELAALRETIAAKLAALEAGERPPVAPIAGEPGFPGEADHDDAPNP